MPDCAADREKQRISGMPAAALSAQSLRTADARHDSDGRTVEGL
jgi:hypothetical protein